jgi:hypothetical protein
MPKPKTVKNASVPVPEVTAPAIAEVAQVVQTITPAPKLTRTQQVAKIVADNTILDTEGRKMFINEDAVYAATSMTPEEATAFLGGKDPKIYFRRGYCHTAMKQTLGELLNTDEERLEYQSFRKTIRDENVLLFKHKIHNLYTILMPKIFTEFELDADGDYVNKYVKQAYHVIAFTGQLGTPSAFEEAFFQRKLKQIKDKIKAELAPKGIIFD